MHSLELSKRVHGTSSQFLVTLSSFVAVSVSIQIVWHRVSKCRQDKQNEKKKNEMKPKHKQMIYRAMRAVFTALFLFTLEIKRRSFDRSVM